jgi:hypothetical protein
MKTTEAGPRRPRVSDYAAVEAAAKLHLCSLAEAPAVRTRHVAALLAFTPTVTRTRSRMWIRLEHGPSAYWLAQALAHPDVELVDVGGDGGTVSVANPQMVLGRYGFRDGQWVFGPGPEASVGICRGAVHAAARFNGHGMKVACPSPAKMLTLTAVMARLDIKAKPTEGEPRAAVSPADVFPALDRLGIAPVGAQYRAALGGRS